MVRPLPCVDPSCGREGGWTEGVCGLLQKSNRATRSWNRRALGEPFEFFVFSFLVWGTTGPSRSLRFLLHPGSVGYSNINFKGTSKIAYRVFQQKKSYFL